ncbi:MAG TPA: hypothetical protein VFB12_03030 [Ktedonobacteraceae bacterium]|nr:hypothetical protein [Ktedonobacteraceae bacterium]
MSQNMYRQGDLLFVKIESLPNNLKERSNMVIAEGEVTGHNHRLSEGRVLENRMGDLFLQVARAARVLHQEHHTITLPPGRYRVVRQREYTPAAPAKIREVRD